MTDLRRLRISTPRRAYCIAAPQITPARAAAASSRGRRVMLGITRSAADRAAKPHSSTALARRMPGRPRRFSYSRPFQ